MGLFNRLPYCFTLQSCYGHFLYENQKDPYNVDPLPATDLIVTVEYRIAYVAFCVENNDAGRALLDAMRRIPAIDPENIQLCSAEWFWERQVNFYALQVEPWRFRDKDMVVLSFEEARKVEQTRNSFYISLKSFLKNSTPIFRQGATSCSVPFHLTCSTDLMPLPLNSLPPVTDGRCR
jgi:hypothetical protein